jgi:hypothetical protein
VTTEYDIRANLTLRDRGFNRTAQRASGRIRAIADRLRGASRAGSGLFGVLTRIGATYLGFHAIVGGIRRAVGGMFDFQMQVERTQIGLQSILAAVDGISFEEAGASARAVWASLSSDALRSTATTQEMFDIFQGIVGPIRAAGQSLETVRGITNSTVAAASALGVDFGQAQRDIGLMVRGTAGMDTRMFALLRSMGLITQETQEWNRNMTTTERIRELERALGSFDAAAAAYGESFAGATSSFKDIVQQLSGALARPIFDKVRQYLLGINAWLIENRDLVEAALDRAGRAIARAMDFVVSHAEAAMNYITARWETLADRFQQVRDALTANAPALQQLAIAVAGLSALRTALGPILSVMSTVVGVFEAMGAIGGGAAAGEAGAGAAAAGGSVMAPVMAALAVVFSMFVSLYSYWEQWIEVLSPLLPIFQALWVQFAELGALVWEILRPIMKVLGTVVLVALIGGLYLFVAVLRVLLTVVNAVMTGMAMVANFFEEWVIDPMIEGILSLWAMIASFLGDVLGMDVGGPPSRAGGGGGGRAAGPQYANSPLMFDPAMYGPTAERSTEDIMGATPDARPSTTNNFHRGSVTVRQDFREADPDRVMTRMVNDINRAAVQRVGSGFAPALTR